MTPLRPSYCHELHSRRLAPPRLCPCKAGLLLALACALTSPAWALPPAAPEVSIRVANSTQLNLCWGLANPPGVTRYEIYRDGAYLAFTDDVFFPDIGLAPGGGHTYQVVAVNADAERSAFSNTVTATTPAAGLHGRTFHVNAATGNDILGNGSEGVPWRTLTHALATMNGGDTLLVHSGTYAEQGLAPPSGSAEHRTIIRGAPLEPMPVIDAERMPPAGWGQSSGSAPVFKLMGRHWITLQGLDIRRGLQANVRIGDDPDYSTRIVVEDCRFSGYVWSDNTAGIYISAGWRDIAIRRCRFEGPNVAGVHNNAIQVFRGDGSLEVSNCEITGNEYGIFFKHGGTGRVETLVRDNLVHDNFRYGLSSSCDFVRIENNLFVRNGTGAHIYLEAGVPGGDRCTISHNTFYDHANSVILNSQVGGADFNRVQDCLLDGFNNELGEYSIWAFSSGAWSTHGNTSDYNLYRNRTGSDIISCMREAFTLAEWQQRTGYDSHSLQAVPMYSGPTAGLPLLANFRLAEGSPGTSAASDGTDMGADLSSVGLQAPPADTYATWAAAHFMPADAADPEIGAPLADPDRTGVTNLLRYACNLPARGPLTAPPASLRLMGEGERTYAALSFACRKRASDLRYSVEASNDLLTWTPLAHLAPGLPEIREVPDLTTTATTPRRLLRLRVELIP